MRLPLIPPADLTPEQRPLYDDMREGIAKSFKGFVAMRDDGTLLGPWNPWLHEPAFGKASWDLVRALADKPSLPKPVRGGRHPRHRRAFQVGLRALRPCPRRRAARPV